MTENLKCNVKLFADDTSLFTVVQDSNTAASDMNHDLELVRKWADDWRMSFNPDPTKQAVELIFSKKKSVIDHPVILFNNMPVMKVDEHKYVGITLDRTLSFSSHIKAAISKTRKGIGMLRFLSRYLLRHTLNELYKLYVRPHLERRYYLPQSTKSMRLHRQYHLIKFNGEARICSILRCLSYNGSVEGDVSRKALP